MSHRDREYTFELMDEIDHLLQRRQKLKPELVGHTKFLSEASDETNSKMNDTIRLSSMVLERRLVRSSQKRQ